MVPFLKDLASGSVSGIFTGLKELISEFHQSPEEKVKALSQVMDFESRMYQLVASMDIAQIELNKAEASSTRLFVSGWRPFIGWVCGGSLAYAVIGYTALNWVFGLAAMLSGYPVPELPKPDTTITLEVLMGMLGMGGLRTYEKLKGLVR